MASIYCLGASATGKTVLAKYIEKEYRIHRLDSASREVFANDYAHAFKDYATLIANKPAYFAFQKKTCALQIVKENEARKSHGSFVSDRCFDHVVYAAFYGSRCPEIANSDMMCDYVADIVARRHNPVVFFCRPSFIIRQAALKDGDRGSFLEWDMMQKFDGACWFILESLGIPYVSLEISDWKWRAEMVDTYLKAHGIEKGEEWE